MDLIPSTLCKITWRGRPSWLYSDGTILPVISGGDGSTDPPKDDNGDGTGGGAGGGGSGNGQQTFTQAELNRIAAREKEEGKRAAAADIAKTLGCTVEEAVELIKQAKAADDSQKTEAQRAREAADKEKADAEKEKAEAAREKHIARVERVLLKAGVPEAKLDRVGRMLDVEVGTEGDKLDEAVKDLKKDFPELFAGKKGGPPDSDPPGTPPKPELKDEAFTRGIERAKQYRGGTFVGVQEGAK